MTGNVKNKSNSPVNIRFVAKTWEIRNFSQNIKSDVKTSEVATLPPFRILVLSSGVWWSLLLDIRCLWRHNMRSFTFANQRFGEVCWHNTHIQGRRSSGSNKRVEGNGNLQKTKKIVTNYVCFCSSTMSTSQIITEIIENLSDFYGRPIDAINCFKSILINHEITYMMLVW